jgi:hypothetical protein
MIWAVIGGIVVAVGFWAVKLRPLDARLARLEKQQAVDSFAFAHQARISHRRIGDLDVRLMYMARDITRVEGRLADTRPTIVPPHP